MKYIIDSITAYAEGNEQKIGIRVRAADERRRELVSSFIVVEPDEIRAAIRNGNLQDLILKIIGEHPALKISNLQRIEETKDAEARVWELAEEVKKLFMNERIVDRDVTISFRLPKADPAIKYVAQETYVESDVLQVEKKTWLDKIKAWVRG